MEQSAGTRYRIEVRGRLPTGAAEQFPGMAVERGPGTSALAGPVADPSALYGLIDRLETLGLALVAIRPDPAPDPEPDPDADPGLESLPPAAGHGSPPRPT